MKKISIILALLLLISLTVSALSSCGNDEVAGSENSQNTPVSSEKDTNASGNGDNVPSGGTVDLTQEIDKIPVSGKKTDEAFKSNQISLALKLFKASLSEGAGDNVLISPLSIQLALVMASNGADGETKAELEALLAGENNLEDLNEYLYTYVKNLPTHEKYKLEIANSIWINSGNDISEDFLQQNKSYYDADIYSAAFSDSTKDEINSWVSGATDGMIDEIVSEINEEAVMYLINTILLEAEWAEKYSEYSIEEGEFTTAAGEKQNVQFMSSQEHMYIETENAIGFQKNYKYGKYSFVALLPDEGISVEELVSGMSEEQLAQILDGAGFGTVHASIPKFSCEYEQEMTSILKSLGVTEAFDEENASFTLMGEANGNIYISQVNHKAYISVDEAGTMAGASTSVEMAPTAAPGPDDYIAITLDRPFVYIITDNVSKLPIFMGIVTSIAE